MTPAPVLLVEDDETYAYALVERLRDEPVTLTRARTMAEALAASRAAPPRLAILDYQLPDGTGLELARRLRADGAPFSIIVLTAFGSIEGAVEAIRAGCLDYVAKDRQLDAIVARVRAALGPVEPRAPVDELGLCGASPAMEALRAKIRTAAAARDTTVLVTGESGSGKQLVARAIHDASSRRERPFVQVDCTTLTASLLESELFGHERGSFTGAGERKLGLVDMAEGGTLFFDEIGELDPGGQSKLLRLCQERSFRRVGGVREHKVDVRIVAATNRSLADEVARGRFREDLYYRVCVFAIETPPLRARGDDVVLLAERFLAELAPQLGRPALRLGDDAIERLRAHPFPGNVRELRTAIERALLSADGALVDGALLSLGGVAAARPGRPRARLSEHDASRIRSAMEAHYGNQSKAARALGISRFALKRRLKLLAHGDGARPRR